MMVLFNEDSILWRSHLWWSYFMKVVFYECPILMKVLFYEGLILWWSYSVGCLWHTRVKIQLSQPIGLRKIFIDYFFFQGDQWDCTKSSSIFNRFASSEERFRTFVAKWFSGISKIQLVVYYQCCVLIRWATTRLYVIAY